MNQSASLNVHCRACGVDAYPSMALNENRVLAPSCPSCGAEHLDLQANDLTETPFAPQEKRAKVVPIRESRIAQAQAELHQYKTPGTPENLMGHIQERIQFLELELAKSAGYAAERKMLVRMVAAAERTKK